MKILINLKLKSTKTRNVAKYIIFDSMIDLSFSLYALFVSRSLIELMCVKQTYIY